MNTTPEPDDDTQGVKEPDVPDGRAGLKLIVASVLLLAYVGYLFYVAFSDPR